MGRFSRCTFLWIVALGAVLGAARVSPAAPFLNLHQALADTKAKLASGGTANIVMLGDSLSFKSGSYLPVFRNLMQQAYGDAGAGYQGFSLWTGGGFNSGWSKGQINADTAPHQSLDGLWASSAAKPYPPTPTSAYFEAWNDHIALHYVAQPGGGRFQIRLPYSMGHGVVETIDTDAATKEIRTWSHTFSETNTNRQLWYQSLDEGDPITILGENNTTLTSGVRIHRAANGGWGVEQFLQRDWTFDQQLDLLDPDLLMIWLGQNDQNYSRSGYATAIGQLVDRLETDEPNAKIVLIGTYDSGSSAIERVVGGMEDVASARGLGFINLYETAGDNAFFESHGYLVDGVHFSDAGGEYMGNLLFNAFQTDGMSLVPEPTSVAIVILGIVAVVMCCGRRVRLSRERH